MTNHFIVVIFLCTILSVGLNAQEFSVKEMEIIENFGLDYKNLIAENPNYSIDFSKFLQKEHKRKGNKIWAYTLGGLGLATSALGILNLADKEDEDNNEDNLDEAGAYQNLVGGFFIAVGVIEIGVSIPLFIASNKRKKRATNYYLK